MIKAKFKSRVNIPPQKKISAQLDLPGKCREEDSYCGVGAVFTQQGWPKSSMSRPCDGAISPLQCDAD